MPICRAQCRTARTGALAILLCAVATPLSAQSSLEEAIRQFGTTNIKGYMQPLADALTASLSSGYFANAAPSMKGGFSLELVGATTMISTSMKTFTTLTPTGFQPSSYKTPTVFGGTAPVQNHASLSGIAYRTSDGILDASIFPVAIPQIRVSGVLGTELVVRYFSSSFMSSLYPDEDLPTLSMYGIGIRHGLNQYFKDLPVDIALSGSYSVLTFGDLADATGLTFGANIGKDLGALSVMGGVESSGGTMNLQYTSTDPQATTPAVNVDVTAKRQVRFVAGATLNAKLFKLFGTAGIGSFTSYSAGLRFGR
ncbi:MAG: hypothetical protein IPP90_16285 [Gemmatimonadaceae bacterium]|nr:hypothetical protein [Gemmatimonadaceae bacterium]